MKQLAHFALYPLIAAARLAYFVSKLQPVRSDVLVISRAPEGISPEVSLLVNQLREQKISVSVLDHGGRSFTNNISAFIVETIRIPQARIVVVERYVPTIGLLSHKKTTSIIQLWHTLGALKKFGWAAADTTEGLSTKTMQLFGVHQHYTQVIVPSKDMRKPYMKAFGVSEQQLVMSTHPRAELLAKLNTNTPKNDSPKRLLYAPTYRKVDTNYVAEFIAASKELTDTYEIEISTHPLDSNIPTTVPSGFTLNTQAHSFLHKLTDYDALVTDYSASALEAAALSMPVLLFRPDKQEYTQSRGLFMLEPWLEGAEVFTTAELTKRLEAADFATPPTSASKAQPTVTELIAELLATK